MKITSIVGARPQFIKASMLSKALANYANCKEIIIHTGQHFDANMSDVFFDEMQIPKPDYNLNINGLKHGAMTGQMLEGIEKILLKEKPDFVLVYGDTNSTLAGALAAKKLQIKVAHIEAGLRSFNTQMPEEINRIITDRISDILFCPTAIAIDNLKKEGFEYFNATVIKNGDVMLDAAMFYAAYSEKKSKIIKSLNLNDFVLSTIHRSENTNNLNNLVQIVSALNEINKHTKVVLPLHPRTKAIISEMKIKTDFLMIEPVGYFDMLELIKNCSMVITDSGGLQKEAFFFHKNCVTTREQTEWTELVTSGANILTGPDSNNILNAYHLMIQKQNDFNIDLFGNGKASTIIAECLLNYSTMV